MRKFIIITMLLIACVSLSANARSNRPATLFEQLSIGRERPLFVKAEIVRFQNEQGQTVFEINYKIPNNELQFIQTQNGYVSNIDIILNIFTGGKLVSENKFSHSAGARTIGIAQSKNHYVLDKLSLTLESDGFTAELEIYDKNASTTFRQNFPLITLPANSLISDIEISNGVSTEFSDALINFERGQYQFYVDPLPVIDGNEKEFVTFHQINNITQSLSELYSFNETITIKKYDANDANPEIVWTEDSERLSEYMPYPVLNRIPLGEYMPGVYTIQITVTDLLTERTQTSERNFSISREYFLQTNRVFSNDEDEFALLSYFLDNRRRRQWRSLSDIGKKSFIERFWVANDPNPASDTNHFLETIRFRVNEANWRFSHHREGWRTDMGRIMIKYGPPNDIEKKATDGDIRVTRREYQIWRYLGSDRIYMFMDFQNNGNFRLIYTKNDDTETTDPGWRVYFGADFDFDNLNL